MVSAHTMALRQLDSRPIQGNSKGPLHVENIQNIYHVRWVVGGKGVTFFRIFPMVGLQADNLLNIHVCMCMFYCFPTYVHRLLVGGLYYVPRSRIWEDDDARPGKSHVI